VTQPGPILELDGLRTWFRMEGGTAKAVDGVDYRIPSGQTLSVVGESGCGKSVTALSIMGLIPCPPGIQAGGRILFKGEDLLQATPERMRKIRGNDIAMIFQEPMTSLNPVFTRASAARTPATRPSRCSPGSASPARRRGSTSTPTR
jgi:peptide/nickel transport system ATP-binding protein